MGIAVPVGRTQAREGRNQSDAATVGNRLGKAIRSATRPSVSRSAAHASVAPEDRMFPSKA